MLFLVNLHNQLDLRVRPEPGKRDLDLLDSALENLWFEIIDLTDQVLRNRILHLSTLPYTLQVVPKKNILLKEGKIRFQKKKVWNFPYFSGVGGFEKDIFHKK